LTAQARVLGEEAF
jgi:hypothetical protein